MSDGVEEGQRALAGDTADRFGERARGQRTRRDNDIVPVGRGKSGDFAAF